MGPLESRSEREREREAERKAKWVAKGEDRRTKEESSSSEWLSWNRKSLVREYRSGKDAVPRGAGEGRGGGVSVSPWKI